MGVPKETPGEAVAERHDNSEMSRSPSSEDTQAAVVKVDEDSKEDTEKKDSDAAKQASLGHYFRILTYLTTKDRMVLAAALICSVASGVPLPLMNIVFGKLVGNFSDYFLPNSTTTESEFKHSVSQLSLYIVYLFIAKFVLTYFSMYCFRVTSLRVSAALRLEYMSSLFSQPISKLDQVSVGTVVNAITTSSNSIQQSISDKLAILFQSIALLIAAYIIAFKYSWALTLATSSAILFIVIVCGFTIPSIIKNQQTVDKANEKHSAIAAEVFGSIRTVISLGAEAPLAKKYCKWVQESKKRGKSIALVLGIQLGLVFFAMYASYSLAFWLGLKLFQQGHIPNINTVITVFFSVMIAVSVLGSIASPLMMVSQAASAAVSFFEIIDADRISIDGERDADAMSGDIVFKNVKFSYPSRPETQILFGLNATFQKGKTTAIVGPSGSGKSTIVALTERWYSPEEGSISVGQRDIKELDLKWWRSNIGLVQQEPFLFNDTIFRNVSFGLVGTKWENEPDSVKAGLVEHACKEAFADEFIDRLPKGYETIVGENGTKLSGGQKQRLAIARSIIKEPTILVLDEATSAIDVRGEKIVQAALDRVSRNRTTIVIAHRLSTVRRADHIIVLRGGLNIEEGTHDELLAMEDGLYHGLVNAQRLENASDDDDDAIEITEVLKEELDRSMTASAEESQDEKKEKKTIRGFFTSVGLLVYESRNNWPLFIPGVFGILGAASAYPLQSWLFAKLILVFSYTGQELTDAANFWSLWFFVLALGIAVCYASVGFASSRISNEMASNCREEYFGNILKMPVPFYDLTDNASGSLVSRLASDPKQIQDLIGLNGAFPVISLTSMIGCIAVAFSFGWKLSLVATFAALPFVFLAAFMRIRYELEFDAMNAAVYSGSSQFAAEAIEAFRTVTALTMEDSILERYSNLLHEQQRKAFRKAWLATLVFAFSDSVELCAMALTFWYGGQLLASREYEPTAFFVVYMSIILGGQQAGQFFSYGPNIAQGTAAANRILDFRQPPQECGDGTEKRRIDKSEHTGAHIEFQQVSFKYESQENPLFTGLDATIESGQFVAFVGASGCGKTSTISMLERFYDPFKGAILFNGQDINSFDMVSYRRTLSLVAQEPRLFEGTIRDNITLGLQSEEYTEEEIVQACVDAEIHGFITSLPEGYSTELGIKAQTSLSGGQRQRLCIARALLRKPTLLLLDEATSSLDSQSEKVVQTALERLAARRSMTIVAVAHRLATIQKADVIFVFGESQNGRGSKIVEQGSHQELLRNKGMYWQMCQASGLDR